LAEEEIIRAVSWRFRICSYLFKLGAAWIVVGLVASGLADRIPSQSEGFAGFSLPATVAGFAIFSVAFVLTLAIYRCPVCDKYLSRFRPQKEYCPSCGAKVRNQ